MLRGLWFEERGQDTVEYTLLLALVVISTAALYLMNQQSIDHIWRVTNNNLSKAQAVH